MREELDEVVLVGVFSEFGKDGSCCGKTGRTNVLFINLLDNRKTSACLYCEVKVLRKQVVGTEKSKKNDEEEEDMEARSPKTTVRIVKLNFEEWKKYLEFSTAK